MAEKTAQAIQAALAKPFAPEDLEWRLQHVNEDKPYGVAVPYVTNRAIQNRLDEVVGPENWCNEYKPWHSSGKKEAQLCGISIYFPDRGQWITKWDGAEDTDIEPIKGGLSDSMKRSAVQWGIGRILYEMDTVFVDVEKRGKTWYIAKKDQSKLDKAYLDMLQAKGLAPAPAGGIQSQLTPREQAEKTAKGQGNAPAAPAPQAEKPRQKPQPEQPTPQPKQGQTAPPAPLREDMYLICSAKVQKGMSGDSTRLVLQGVDCKQKDVFLRGAHPELVPGVTLAGVKLETRQQDTVVFYILTDYRIVTFHQEAA